MAGNEFDPSTMPSAEAARREDRRMFRAFPVYILIAGLIGLCIIAAVIWGAASG